MNTSTKNNDELKAGHDNRLLNKDEVAEILHTTSRHVERLAEQGLLAHFRVGRFYRFQLREVEDYLARTHIEVTGPR